MGFYFAPARLTESRHKIQEQLGNSCRTFRAALQMPGIKGIEIFETLSCKLVFGRRRAP